MTYFEWDESRDYAEALVEALGKQSVLADVFADPNGVPAAQVYLTEEVGEFAPCLMVGTESTVTYGASEMAEWFGQLNSFGVEMHAVMLRVVGTPAEVARELKPFIEMLKNGAVAFHAAHPSMVG